MITSYERERWLQHIIAKPFSGCITILEDERLAAAHASTIDDFDLANELMFWTDASKKGGDVGAAIV